MSIVLSIHLHYKPTGVYPWFPLVFHLMGTLIEIARSNKHTWLDYFPTFLPLPYPHLTIYPVTRPVRSNVSQLFSTKLLLDSSDKNLQGKSTSINVHKKKSPAIQCYGKIVVKLHKNLLKVIYFHILNVLKYLYFNVILNKYEYIYQFLDIDVVRYILILCNYTNGFSGIPGVV